MKTKLLKRLRRKGRSMVNVRSIIRSVYGTVTGMSYGYDYDCYGGLWHFGMTEEELKKEAERIYINWYLSKISNR